MTKHQKYVIWEPLLLAIMVAIGMLVGSKMNEPKDSDHSDLIPHQVGALEEILRFVEAKYVDSVDRNDLNHAAIESILANLDPHSKYIPPDEVSSIKEDMEGSYFGVGMSLSRTLDSSWAVTRVIEGSPADLAGIRPGFVLIRIDSIDGNLSKTPEKEIQLAIRGEQGTMAKATFLNLDKEEMHVQLSRQKIPISSIELSEMLNDSVGVIGINRFSSKTYQEFMQALEELYKEGLNDLIIDVRSNPGGYLQETVKIISQFVSEKGLLLVYTEGENSRRNDYESNGRIFHPIDDIVILIDENSASASEILAGSLQDLDRALVLGRRSFGKGLVQEQYDLSNGGAIRLTTGRYYTPSGRLIQKNYEDPALYSTDLQNRYQSGEMMDEGLIPILDSSQHYTNAGRLVYGGGGVTPDVFIADQNPFGFADWPVIHRYIKAFVLTHLPEWKDSIPQEKSDFLQNYQPANYSLDSLIHLLETEWPSSAYDDETHRNFIHSYFKAFVAKYYFNSDEMFFLSLYQNEEIMARAIKIIGNDQVDDFLLNTTTAIRE